MSVNPGGADPRFNFHYNSPLEGHREVTDDVRNGDIDIDFSRHPEQMPRSLTNLRSSVGYIKLIGSENRRPEYHEIQTLDGRIHLEYCKVESIACSSDVFLWDVQAGSAEVDGLLKAHHSIIDHVVLSQSKAILEYTRTRILEFIDVDPDIRILTEGSSIDRVVITNQNKPTVHIYGNVPTRIEWVDGDDTAILINPITHRSQDFHIHVRDFEEDSDEEL